MGEADAAANSSQLGCKKAGQFGKAPAFKRAVSMALGPLIFLAALALVHHPRMVSDRTDLATLNRLQDHEKRMKQEMERLQTEFDQKGWTWGPLETPKDWMTADQPMDDETSDKWHYVRLILLFLFICYIYTLEKEPSDDSSTDTSSTTTSQEEEEDDDSDMETETENRQQMLQAFYDRCMEVNTSDLNNMCNFVESFVNDLLEACRNDLPYPNTLPLLENCIGVDSAFEGWHTPESKPFSVLVPILPPKGHSFHLETTDSEGIPSKHGHVLVEMECVCKRERLLGDVMCFLHRPEQKLSEGQQGAFLLHVLCTSFHLDVDKTIHWFQSLVQKAWQNIRYKYNLDLQPQPSDTSCRLKLAFKSGRTIFVDIILGVQQGDSLVFLATQGVDMDRLAGTVWQKTFAIQELLFFKWVSQRAPGDTWHLKCLQLLIYLKESNPDRKFPVLTNYHYKNCLMHLLLFRPLSDWGPEDVVQRLHDILLFMYTALKEKRLHHFLIGNISLPIQIPVPKTLRSAAPLNLFKHLAQDPNLHAEAMREFVELVEQVRPLLTECEE